ncbi:MAG: hypothetical protein N2490_02795 [Ignavibacteria bacterium]|nr:hypothetical protein [Ignavibacteria bacterium]
MNTEEKYPEIREKLRKLPRIKARDDFLNRLLNKINLLENQPAAFYHSQKEDYDKELQSEKSLSQKVLEKFSRRKPAWNWLVPTVSFAVILLVIFSYLLVLRNVETPQETISSPEVKQESEVKPNTIVEEPKIDKIYPDFNNENSQYSEAREEFPSKKENLTKELPKPTNEAGMVAPIERKELDVKKTNEPPINGKNNDGNEVRGIEEKTKKDETDKKLEEKKEIDTKGKVEGGRTRSAIVPPQKKKSEIEKEGLIEDNKKPKIEIKPDSIKK